MGQETKVDSTTNLKTHKLKTPLILLIALFLVSCTKTVLDDNKINDYSSLEVTQVKGNTVIHFNTEPKEYYRTVTVICVYGSQEIGTQFLVLPNETDVFKSYSVNAVLTSYHLLTFAHYHE